MKIDYDNYDIIIVGAGLSGCVMAERFAFIKKKVLIIEKRNHIGGNCYDFIDENGILMNKYGAHLFHTNDEDVWEYINRFHKWIRWEHKVLGMIDNRFVPIPVNISTVNIICHQNIKSQDEMDIWLKSNRVDYKENKNKITSEDIAKNRVGEILYNKIFKYYTFKQWGKYPYELHPDVLARIPVRNNFDERYFSDKYQALPDGGYTKFFNHLIKNPLIDIQLNVDFLNIRDAFSKNKIIIYTGPIDYYYRDCGFQKLEYRSIRFVEERYKNMNYYQPNSVINYPELNVEYTRIVEYKHFLNQSSPHTTIVKEFTNDYGEPYYPVLNEKNLELYQTYKLLADQEKNIHFLGRLANYKYFNMDQAIKNALDYFNNNFQNLV